MHLLPRCKAIVSDSKMIPPCVCCCFPWTYGTLGDKKSRVFLVIFFFTNVRFFKERSIWRFSIWGCLCERKPNCHVEKNTFFLSKMTLMLFPLKAFEKVSSIREKGEAFWHPYKWHCARDLKSEVLPDPSRKTPTWVLLSRTQYGVSEEREKGVLQIVFFLFYSNCV